MVDLGVGLWAWPLPMDFDHDGDLDLVVSCPDVPFRGTYLFENPGGSGRPQVPGVPAPATAGARLSRTSGRRTSAATPVVHRSAC